MLHKIPPLYAAGRANSLLTMGPPNYSAIETTNRITTEGGTWTVDRDGYVAVLIQNLTAGYSAICAINGKWVGRAFSGVGTGAAGDVQAMHTGVHQVCKGDVVKLLVDDGTANTNMYCYYIPPVINPPLYVTGMPILSYSTAEQDTGIKWYNGKTIYQKSFTGTVSLPANSNVTVISLPGAEDFVDGWGIISRSPSSGIKIPGRSLDSSEAATHFMSDITITNGNIYCTARSDVAINPAGYLVTFQYTK
jgi:hypothetical protein